jgi:hypothetical protein
VGFTVTEKIGKYFFPVGGASGKVKRLPLPLFTLPKIQDIVSLPCPSKNGYSIANFYNIFASSLF